MNYFAFYELPVQFNLDLEALRMLYLQKSKAFHPDFFVNDDAQYQHALEITSQNNQAYKVLSDPLMRLKHILDLQGVLGEKESVPAEFLMEMMDLNEALAEAKAEGGEALQEALEPVNAFEIALDEALAFHTAQFDEQGSSPEVLERLKDIFLKYRYLRRLKE